MSKESKVWVIDPTAYRNRRKHSSVQNGSEKVLYEGVAQSEQQPAPSAESRGQSERYYQRSSSPLIFLAYLLGPFSSLATDRGRRSRFWFWFAAGSGVVSVMILWWWREILARLGSTGAAILPWFILSCLVILAGITSWSRGILLIGQSARSVRTRLPRWIRKPWTIGTLGLILPGAGLLIGGRPKRAAGALWMCGLFLLSIFVLSQSVWLWEWNRGIVGGAIPNGTLEYIFLVLGVLGSIGILAWIVQALEGARLAVSATEREKRPRPRGDVFAFALLVTIVAYSVLFEPVTIAGSVDRFAETTQHEGLQVLPLYAARTAMWLDPSQPSYAVRAIGLYDDLGKEQIARVMRRELYERWKSCEGEFKRHGLISRGAAPELTRRDTGMQDVTLQAGGMILTNTWDQFRAAHSLFDPPGGNGYSPKVPAREEHSAETPGSDEPSSTP